jgi:hypothetical protein
MEALFTDKLKLAGFREVDEVSRNSRGDCMFLCFLKAIRAYRDRGVNHARGISQPTPQSPISVPLPTHRLLPIADRKSVDISTAFGMRQLVVDAATAMLSTDTPEKLRTDLRMHILHRFKSQVMRSRDAEVEGYEPPADVSEEDKINAWKQLMQTQGAKLYKLTA